MIETGLFIRPGGRIGREGVDPSCGDPEGRDAGLLYKPVLNIGANRSCNLHVRATKSEAVAGIPPPGTLIRLDQRRVKPEHSDRGVGDLQYQAISPLTIPDYQVQPGP